MHGLFIAMHVHRFTVIRRIMADTASGTYNYFHAVARIWYNCDIIPSDISPNRFATRSCRDNVVWLAKKLKKY